MGQVLSVHMGEPGSAEVERLLQQRPGPDTVDGMRWAEMGRVLEFRPGPGPSVEHPSCVGLLAIWDSDEAVDQFLDVAPLVRRFDWHLRMEAVRIYGAWHSLTAVPRRDKTLGPDDPVAVVTMAYTRASQFPRFVRTSAPAERASAESPDAKITIGIVCPPRFVSSFSLWRTVAGMLAFAHPKGGGPHADAIEENRRAPFHRAEAFLRCRPYGEQGHWPLHR